MEKKEYPYVNNMEINYNPLELIDIKSIVNQCTDKWYNETLCKVNESVVRLGVLEGEYHWHKHDSEDEFFFTLSGSLLIDIKDQETVELKEQQGYLVPKGVLHRTRAKEKTVVLMIETAEIVPTGD